MTDAEKPALRPANDNPWYCLATLHGEQPIKRWDWELAEKNRLAWNRWTGDLTEGQRAEYTELFALRTDGRPLTLPEPTADADFSYTLFDRKVDFDGFRFASPADFSYARWFSGSSFKSATFGSAAHFTLAFFATRAVFSSAYFSKSASFDNVTFSEFASFDSATFADLANFQFTRFSTADFDKATFSYVTTFHSATVVNSANFRSATFSTTNFSSATFSAEVSFVDAKFKAITDFAEARFQGEVPDFRGATFHDATEWHGVIWPKPPKTQWEAQRQVYAYERLKQEMERLKKHEDEQNFFRRELRARRGLVRVWSGAGILNLAYQALSDYGNSISRPLLWLFGVFVIGAAIFARAPLYCGAPMPIKLATKLSFANIFVFLPDKREIMLTNKMVECLSNTTQAVSASQSMLGVVLLFLLGLALRNRFRMK